MNHPLLTIGLPVFNDGKHLEAAMRSILAQTFGDWELIAIDDGSTDNSFALLSRFRDPRIRLLSYTTNQGLGARLNQIALLARAPYVARMDADDLIHPTRFEKQMEFLERSPEVDGLGCGLLSIDERERLCGMRIFPQDHAGICANPLVGIVIAHSTLVAQRDWLLRNPYNCSNRHCEDFELWCTTYRSSHFANLAEPLYAYREFESYSLPRYLGAKRVVTRLLWQQREHFGAARTAVACFMQGVRMAVNIAGSAMGMEHYLVQRRSKAPSALAERMWRETMAAGQSAERAAAAAATATVLSDPEGA